MVNRYYLIELPAPDGPGKDRGMPLVDAACEVIPVEVAQAYERNQIVNRSGSHEVSYYKYHLWATRPSVAVREVVLRYFEQTGVFGDVSNRFSLLVPEYLFRAHIRQLEVLEDKNQFSAHLHLGFTLLRNDNRQVLLEHEADRTIPLEDKDLNLFAEAISRILQEELQAFRLKLEEIQAQQEI